MKKYKTIYSIDETINTNSSLTVKNNLNVTGKTTIKDISGSDASFNNIDIDGDANIDKNLTVGVDTNIVRHLNVTGKTTIKDISGATLVLTISTLMVTPT